MKKKIIRATTVPLSLDIFCRHMLQELSAEYEVVGVCSNGPEFNAIKEREGVRLIEVPMERQISFSKDLKSLVALIKVFRKEKPDMVHSMTPKAGLLCMIAAWLARVPVRVHTFTGLVWPTATGLSRRILKMTDRITCFCATHVIPEGQGVLEDLRDGGITKKPMRVLGYGNVRGIDLDYWKKTPQAPLSRVDVSAGNNSLGSHDLTTSQPFTFLFVGRIVGDKGINELVSAFEKLIENQKNLIGRIEPCRLLLVGWVEDKYDPVSEETKQKIESTPEIEAVGPKYEEELLQCYAESDCFVFPSCREGFPNTVLEAGAMELPCIVTDINGSREIICRKDRTKELNNERILSVYQHLAPGEKMSIRENGVVIPSKDADALYDAMLWMMTHEEERKQMAASARSLVASRFEQSFVRQQLYDFYHEVLG